MIWQGVELRESIGLDWMSVTILARHEVDLLLAT